MSEASTELALQWVERIERTVRGVGERSMRSAVLREMLQDLDADALLAALCLLGDRAKDGGRQARAVMQEMALERNVFEGLHYEVRQRVYSEARRIGRDEIAAMLLPENPSLNPTVGQMATDNEYASASVGERCAQARLKERAKLDRLVHDRDYRVIQVLLDNPIIVERDVVKIAAMRPTRAEVLMVIARHRRWASRYPVRKALALNPLTPLPVARRLVPTLMKQDLRAVVDTGAISAEVRALARGMLSGS
jgi:hypothetical protein